MEWYRSIDTQVHTEMCQTFTDDDDDTDDDDTEDVNGTEEDGWLDGWFLEDNDGHLWWETWSS